MKGLHFKINNCLKVCVVFKSYHFTLTTLYSALLSLYNL